MWRSVIALPRRGRIGIFNRSHYEECLVVRVHPEILAQEKIPSRLVTRNIWRERFEDISSFERYLARNGTIILKFVLNISKEEQRERFLARLDEPSKNWKFSMVDVAERARLYRVDQRLTRETGGVGLGLSIVELIARAHGGTATVRSEPGSGSAFTLRLPQADGGGAA